MYPFVSSFFNSTCVREVHSRSSLILLAVGIPLYKLPHFIVLLLGDIWVAFNLGLLQIVLL